MTTRNGSALAATVSRFLRSSRIDADGFRFHCFPTRIPTRADDDVTAVFSCGTVKTQPGNADKVINVWRNHAWPGKTRRTGPTSIFLTVIKRTPRHTERRFPKQTDESHIAFLFLQKVPKILGTTHGFSWCYTPL